ncbi:hypothetical protein F5Y14DRAFT_380242 [Nemania sp. NC0429]|nr:hypothetical protein F5Y14DRAFT_380242 [Nemania sp. NC0429]
MEVMSWLATTGALAASTARFLARLLYVLATPLRWLLSHVYAAVLFLLSPVRALFNFGLGVISFAVNLMAGLKFLYIYLACAAIIGFCAGFVLHGTSGFIFVLLGVDAASEQRKRRDQDQRLVHAPPLSPDVGYEMEEYDEESTPSMTRRRLDRRRHAAEIDADELFGKRWSPLRTLKQPRRARKGLIGQTIHEESSGSDIL